MSMSETEAVALLTSAVTSSSYTVDTGDMVDLAATITSSGTTPVPEFEVSFYVSSDANVSTSTSWWVSLPSLRSMSTWHLSTML